MDKIFYDSEEKYLAEVVLYAKASGDTYLYTDSANTTTINRADLLNLCMKGLCAILFNGEKYTPVSFKDSGSVVTVTIATVSSTAFVVKTFTSKETA